MIFSVPRYAWIATVALMAATMAFPLFTTVGHAQTEGSDEKKVAKQDFKKLKTPVPYSKRSISRGRQIYIRYCTECHGPDGKALMDVIADATDLTNPKRWLSGTTEGEIFRSIRDGAGVSMPPFSMQMKKEEDMWHLVNYIRSLWPKDKRPELQDPNKKKLEAKQGSTTPRSEGESHE
jgi:mono/diheme cytochrome c family protein